MAILSDEVLESVRQLQNLRMEMARMRAEETRLREQIIVAMGEDLKGVTGSGAPATHVEIQHRRQIDRGRLEAMFPEIFDKVIEEKMSAILKIDLVPEVVG